MTGGGNIDADVRSPASALIEYGRAKVNLTLQVIARRVDGYHDLEAPAMRIQPAIGEVLSALRSSDRILLARMSGSGATCFALYSNAADAGRAAQKLRTDHPQWWVHAGTLS